MKKISLILSFFVCFLIVHPVVKSVCNFSKSTTVQVCSNNCCIISKKTCEDLTKTEKSEKPCCPNGLCNPFENCPLCCMVVSEKMAYTIPVFENTKKIYISYNEFAKGEYLFSFFQKPFY